MWELSPHVYPETLQPLLLFLYINMAINDLGPVLIELQKTTTHIQWRPQSTGDWLNLLPLTDINGHSIEMRQNAGYVQWRVKGATPEDTWKDLYLVSKGDQGNPGKQGLAGQSARISTESTAVYHDPLTNATPIVNIDTAGNDLQRVFQFRFEFADPVRIRNEHDTNPEAHQFLLEAIKKAQLAGQQWLEAVPNKSSLPKPETLAAGVNYLCYVRSDITPANNGTWQKRANGTDWEKFSDASDFVRPDTLKTVVNAIAPQFTPSSSLLTIIKGTGFDANSVTLRAAIANQPASRAIPSGSTHDFHNLFQTIRNNLRWLTERFQEDTTHANTAVKLATAHTLQVNLGVNTAASFNGSANVHNIGVSGTLPVERGGTSMTQNPSMLIDLASTTAANVFQQSPRPGVTGMLPLAHGGLGSSISQNTSARALHIAANGTAALAGTLPIEAGGTNATTATAARTNLGITLTNLGGVPLASPAFSGTPTCPTPILVVSPFGGSSTGILPIEAGGTNASTTDDALNQLGAAPLASPTFSGTPTSPTPALP